MVSEWIESVKPVAWSGTRQVALVPNGESPLAQLYKSHLVAVRKHRISLKVCGYPALGA